MSEHTSDLDFLPQRATPCLARLARENSWSRTLALRVGALYVGVRVDSPSTAAELEESLSTHRVPRLDGVAPPNFSVRLSAAESARDGRAVERPGGPRRLNLIYRNHEVVARRESPRDLLRDLVALLESTTYSTSEGHLAIGGSAVATPDGEVILLPPSWYRLLVPQRRRLEANQGLDLLPGEVHLVDPRCGTRVGGTTITCAERWPERSDRVVCWGQRLDVPAPQPLRAAQGVHAAVSTVANLKTVGPRSVLQALSLLSQRVGFVALPATTATAAVAIAGALAHAAPTVAAADTRPH